MGRKIFALAVFVAFFYITTPLFFPIAMGGILATLFLPLLNLLERKGLPRYLGTGVLTLGATILLIFPSSLLIFNGAKTGFLELQAWRFLPSSGKDLVDTFLSDPKIDHLVLWMSDLTTMEVSDFSKALHQFANFISAHLADLFGGVMTQIPRMLLFVMFMVLSLYFFLLDGRRLIAFIRKNSFFNANQTDLLIERMGEISRSVVLAAIVSGGLQATLEMITCAFTRTTNVALIGLLVFISSFIPLVGSLPVTVGVALLQFLEGRHMSGLVLIIVGMLLFLMDNAVRSLFLRGSANLHPFLAFIAALGGLQTLGFVGVFIGPICAALFLVTLQILTESEGV